MLWCRVGATLKSPQLAKQVLSQGEYQPCFSTDVWALGLLLLQLTAGSIPPKHYNLLAAPDYHQECANPASQPTMGPGKKAHFTYLSSRLDSNVTDYADEVRLAACLLLCTAVPGKLTHA